MSRKRKRLLFIVGGVVLLSLVCLLAGWICAPVLLTVGSAPHPANAIVVLGGDPGDRTLRAIEIYDAVQPRWVIISGSEHDDRLQRVMQEHGIPADKILLEEKSTTTLENAANSVAMLRERGLTNAVVVTSWFHSRRALACFRKVAPDLTIQSCSTEPPRGRFWWPNKYERPYLNAEYGKILYYAIVHGVWLW